MANDKSTIHLGRLGHFDLQRALIPWEKRRAEGKAMRRKVPRESHGVWEPGKKRRDPVEIVLESNRGRQAKLIPLRMGRMAASPFAFFRGAAEVMAADLASTPISGTNVVIDGDAHLGNFGFFGTPQREVIFDLNDFDETTVGPWEWDLKRLAASVNVAARENGLNKKERRVAVQRCVYGYRWNVNRLQKMGMLDTWYLHSYPGRENPLVKIDPKSAAVIQKCVAKAEQSDNHNLLGKVAERGARGQWRFRDEPPILKRVDRATRESVIGGLTDYVHSIPRERSYMLSRYHVEDVAHRVVGVGSVAMRAYLVLLFGNSYDDPLFLQVKEAAASAYAPYLPALSQEFAHEGKRVVMGQRALQASTDVMLGWTQIDGRDFYVRQMKNMKAAVPMEWLTGASFNFYAFACGSILARAHARTGDAALIAGYCGMAKILDNALADFAEAYGNQTENDHAALVKAIQAGRVKAETDEGEPWKK
ncbi:MAG TPA: DUF2252 domain-containing protein [Acidobacteriaceae bacterium]|jgi:uncharacterized protein (DUF2252 family)|nr:DUF2252 domain-containing protein [Acidobacteriaceae bacterium]